MRIQQLPVGPFEMNCYIVSDEKQKECVLIDPGDETQRIIDHIKQAEVEPACIILTHCHLDHAWKAAEIQSYFKVPLYLGEADLPLLETINEQGVLFNMGRTEIPQVSGFLSESQPLNIGMMQINFLHTPGHSPGSFCLHLNDVVFAGDVLFRESIGRTDLYGGNYDTLLRSIREKLLPLPDSTTIYPGHGPSTTIGYEKRHNPFLNPGHIPFS